jgi:hypothetical protein
LEFAGWPLAVLVVFGIGPVAVGDLPLDNLDRHALHRCLIVAEQAANG